MLQRKILSIYDTVRERFYRCSEDLEVSGVRFNSALLFVIIGFINRLVVAIFGNPGSGKTTVAEVTGALLSGIPHPAVVSAMIRGSPEFTEERLHRLDLGKLQQGSEEVIWSSFVKCPIHLIDEVNRIPEIKQAAVLEGIRTGRWIYLGQMIQTGKTPLYATANYEDLGTGTFKLIAALADRFAFGVEAGYPGARTAFQIALQDTEEAIQDCGLADYADEAIALLNARHYDPASIVAFCEKFKAHLEQQRGLPVVYAAELEEARRQIAKMSLSLQATRFLTFLLSVLNTCARTGQKRSTHLGEDSARRECPDDCRFVESICSDVIDGGSRRQERDIVLASQSLAWLLGEPRVEPHHVMAVAPYCLSHRRKFSRKLLVKAEATRRTRPVQFEAAHQFVDAAYTEFTDMKNLIDEFYRRLEKGLVPDPDEYIKLGTQQAIKLAELHPHLQDIAEDSRKGGGYDPRDRKP